MGLFNKKEEVPKIPTLASPPKFPSSSTLPPLPPLKEEQGKKELPELPSFPSSSKNEVLNQQMVKSAVSDTTDQEEQKEPEMRELEPLTFPSAPTQDHDRFKPSSQVQTENSSPIPEAPSIQASSPILEMPKPQENPIPPIPSQLPASEKTIQKQDDLIFVRIDKFQSAQKNFLEIKDKVSEIESVINKIKEVKIKEEEELRGWTEDIEKLKARLSEIDNDIFNRL